jgi:hypothetical protein
VRLERRLTLRARLLDQRRIRRQRIGIGHEQLLVGLVPDRKHANATQPEQAAGQDGEKKTPARARRARFAGRCSRSKAVCLASLHRDSPRGLPRALYGRIFLA